MNLVAAIATDQFKWLFKRNHQEHDFGIDGQMEVITEEGLVTGQILATQIKHGESYLRETNRWGYVYRGETKHFNYLSNYPVPVLIIICDPATKTAYWTRFVPEETRPTEGGWTLTVPFANRLSESKAALLSLLGPVVDKMAALQEYWRLNKLLVESETVMYIVDPDDVATCNVGKTRMFFDRLRVTKELALQCQGKMELIFFGFDDDPRELFEIPEVRTFVAALAKALPELLFYVRTGPGSHTLKVFVSCLCDAKWEGKKEPTEGYVSLDTTKLRKFLMDHWPGLNEMTDWLGMSTEENMRITFAVADECGLNRPDAKKRKKT
ncbi:MAG: DUF4365 and DUF1817 domain-containing protein [Phycisphaeraceae bacterium]|nr:DUF4365 and DUF1817 domain-containing protein [Phycisphaeraceae bacterium]